MTVATTAMVASSEARLPLRPFSFEDPASGQRRFAACTLRDFWAHYGGLIPSQRHFYEILREGTPCRLYLDLEFSRADNPQADGSSLTAALLQASERVTG